MPQIAAIVGVIGSIAGAAGSLMQASAAKKRERLERKRMQMQAERDRREQRRKAIIARSQALTAGVQGGAEFGSGVAGGMGSVTSQSSANQGSINRNQVISEQISDANMKYIQGGALSSLGGAIVSASGSLGSLGETYFGRKEDKKTFSPMLT